MKYYEASRTLRSEDSGQIVEPRAQPKHGDVAFSFGINVKIKKSCADHQPAERLQCYHMTADIRVQHAPSTLPLKAIRRRGEFAKKM